MTASDDGTADSELVDVDLGNRLVIISIDDKTGELMLDTEGEISPLELIGVAEWFKIQALDEMEGE